MAEPDDVEPRVEALEGEVERLKDRMRRGEQDAAAARILAGGADRDVADLGGEVREFRAEFRDFKSEMYEFKSEMYDFRTQNNRVINAFREDVNERFAQVDRNFAEMRGRFDATAAGQQQIVRMLDMLIARDEPGAAGTA